jgi:hypothetical protein
MSAMGMITTRCQQRVAFPTMGTTCETIHGDPIIFTGWDTDVITIHCGCGTSIDVPAGVGLWQILRAYIDHETGE